MKVLCKTCNLEFKVQSDLKDLTDTERNELKIVW